MLFEVNGKQLIPKQIGWEPSEKDLENLIISTAKAELNLDYNIFGEYLFFVDNQKRGSNKKILDIIALDEHAQGVIIELKKDKGSLGVETQALQYLSDTAQYTGDDFIKEFKLGDKEGTLEAFFYEGITVKDINQRSRIILIAREFDESLYSMGQWLANQGISFKCIKYAPHTIEGNQYLSFSVSFDQSSDHNQYRVNFKKRKTRKSDYFWHNLGSDDSNWLAYLYDSGQISASFNNQECDRGEVILKNYISGDVVFAYVSGIGCLGYGKIKGNGKYKLIKQGSDGDVFDPSGLHLHRLPIEWKAFLPENKAITAKELREKFEIATPVQTSSKIRKGNIKGLIEKIEQQAN